MGAMKKLATARMLKSATDQSADAILDRMVKARYKSRPRKNPLPKIKK